MQHVWSLQPISLLPNYDSSRWCRLLPLSPRESISAIIRAGKHPWTELFTIFTVWLEPTSHDLFARSTRKFWASPATKQYTTQSLCGSGSAWERLARSLQLSEWLSTGKQFGILVRLSPFTLFCFPRHGNAILTTFYHIVASSHYTTSPIPHHTVQGLSVNLKARDQRKGDTPNQVRTALPRVKGTFQELCSAAALDTTLVIGKIMVS